MARTLSTATATEIAKAVTRPFYLARIEFPGVVTYYLSTGATVTWLGYTWDGGNLTVDALRTLPGGGLEGALSLTNADGSGAALALNGSLEEVLVDLWALYGDGPYATEDATQVFSGVLDGAEIGMMRVRFGLSSESRRRATGPRIYCAPPLCNHLVAPGSVLYWSGERYGLLKRTKSVR